jgi:3-oxoacyl-[acyl-carrier protein] reductase
MDLGLRGKAALVTGSSRGIGHAIALRLAAEGCRVVMNGRDEAGLAAAVYDGAVGIAADVTDMDDCRRLLEETVEALGGLDILVCNVGSGASVPPGRETAEEWRRVMEVNLFAATNMVEAAGDAMHASRGSLLFVSSICGQEALGAPVTYSAAKSALNSFVRGIARPFGAHGVNVNAVAPGNILFEGSVWARKIAEDNDAVEAMLDREVALKRLGRPEEIADLAAFLVSPRAAFISGEIVVVDGGQVRG